MNPFAIQLDASARDFGDALYLSTPGGIDVSFAGFRERAFDVAAALRDHGVRYGDRVAMLIDNRPEFVIAWYACQLIGATAAALNPTLPADSQRHLLRLIEARVCLRATAEQQPGADAALKAEQVPVAEVDSLPAGGGGALAVADLPPGHASQIIFSSGTTGRPKGAVQTADILTGLLSTAKRIGLIPEDRLIINSPMFHGLAQSWYQYGLGLGAPVLILPRFSPSQYWDMCRRFGATAMQHVGAVLSYLLRQSPTADDLDNPVRLTFGVGAPRPVWEEFQRRFGVEVIEFYGMTEVGLLAFNTRPGRLGSVGRPAGALEVRLVDDNGVPVPTGQVGEAWSRPVGPGGMRPNYFGDPEATAAAETDGWFRTGDLLYADDDGYLYFVGRRKESLRRRGENIVPEDIERMVEQLAAVEQCAAVAVRSEHGDDDIKLCLIVGAIEPDEAFAARLGKEICGTLPATMRPRYLSFYREFPTTATNKVQRLRLRDEAGRTVWDIDTQAWSRSDTPGTAA